MSERARPLAPCRRILLASSHSGIDLAPAIRTAARLSERHDAGVEVAVAFEPRVPYPGASRIDVPSVTVHGVAPSDQPEAANRLAHVRQQLAATLGEEPDWPLALEVGHAPLAIVRAAERCGADLIVLGLARHDPKDLEHGKHRDRSAALVALYSSAPVLAVAPGSTDLPGSMLVAVGLDESVVHAARVVQHLLPPPRAVYLVHVAHNPTLVQTAVNEQFDRVLAALAPQETARVERSITRGDEPWPTLVALARLRRVDLVVGGLHGSSSVERALMRNTALQMMANADSSTIVVPSAPARDYHMEARPAPQ